MGRQVSGRYGHDTFPHPRPLPESIGIEPCAQREYALAEGSEFILDFTTTNIEIMGEIVGLTVVFADAGTEPFLDRYGARIRMY